MTGSSGAGSCQAILELGTGKGRPAALESLNNSFSENASKDCSRENTTPLLGNHYKALPRLAHIYINSPRNVSEKGGQTMELRGISRGHWCRVSNRELVRLR